MAWCLLASSGQLHAENPYAHLTQRIAALAGLAAPAGEEVRVWSVSDAADQNYVIVLRREAAGVRGQVVRCWPARYAPDPKWLPPGWRCARHVVQPDLRLCRAAFDKQPDWAALLRDFEGDDVWSLPDGSDLQKKDKDTLAHGASLTVELLRSGASRAYTYPLPQFLTGPHAVKAERIRARSSAFIGMIDKSGAR